MAILEKLPAGFLLLYKEWLEAELSQYPVDVKKHKRSDNGKEYLQIVLGDKSRYQTGCNTERSTIALDNYKTGLIIQNKIKELNNILSLQGDLQSSYHPKRSIDSNDNFIFETIYENTMKKSKNNLKPGLIPHGKYLVRSKSEDCACCIYDEVGTKYCYEPLLTKVQILPDFAVLIPFLNFYYIHEHFGMIDDPEYRARFLKKINSYIDAGFIPGKNLLITFETSTQPATKDYLENQIAAFITNAYYERIES